MADADVPSNIAAMRREYALKTLNESDVAADPIEQFRVWFTEAQNAKLIEPNAMTLATADASDRPSARIVLLKEFDARGFVFFTNYHSRKGRDLESNPRACLNLFWDALERQVRIDGTVEKVSRQESETYFRVRPREAQIGAWVSHQGETISSREELDRRYAELEKKFGAGEIPIPDYWGGYRVGPDAIEFWQGRPSRLHDRILYTRDKSGKWTISRLSP